MHPPRFLIARWTLPVLAVLGSGIVHADPAEEARSQAKIKLWQFADNVSDATKNGMFGNNFASDPSACTKAIEDGTAAGLKPTDTFQDGDSNTVLWKRAGKVCDDYARLHRMATTIKAIQPMLSTVRAWTGPDGKPHSSATGDAYRATVVNVTPCLDIIDKAIAGGVAADLAFAPNDNQGDTLITLPQARKICTDYIDFGSKQASADDDRAANELAAQKAKYGAFGITGDRLAYVIAWGHRPIWGKGCVELSGKTLKSSPVFYDLGQDDLAWIVYKTQFKGDKKVKYTQRRFRKDGDYSCK